MTFLNIQELYLCLAVLFLNDLNKHENPIQEKHLKKVLQLHSGLDFDKRSVSRHLKRSLYEELKESSPSLRHLVDNVTLTSDV